MKPGILHRSLVAALPAILLALPESALACAACFGRSDSPMARGMNMGILSLLLIVMAVLAGIAAFFVYLMVRAARYARTNPGTTPFPSTPVRPTP